VSESPPLSTATSPSSPRDRALALRGVLRGLPCLVRLGVSCLMLTMLLGLGASGMVIYTHYENRDEVHGLTMDDLRAGYHGLLAEAPIGEAIKRGHPAGLPADQREVLVKWLSSDRVPENYDNIDLGVSSPSEIIATSCVSCHSRKADRKDPKVGSAPDWPLEFKDDALKLAVSKSVQPAAKEKLAASTHLHAPAMAMMGLMMMGLLWLTRVPRGVVGVLAALIGVGLALDIGGWWISREYAGFVPMIAIAGAAFNGACGVAMALVVVDAWWPGKR
jgi:hypothetical protein